MFETLSNIRLPNWLVALVFASCFSQLASAQSLELSEPTTQSLLTQAKLADQHLADRLQKVIARGRIRHTAFFHDLTSPTITLDADVQVVYDAPKFQLHLQYAIDQSQDPKLDKRLPDGEQDEKEHVIEQTLLFDGQTLTKLQTSSDGTCRGDIYFDFHRPNMLRMAGFPFENPIELWREPLQIDRADLLGAQTTPLSTGGFVGVLTKDTYRLKFYFFGSFGYDLRRVSSYRLGQDTPFRDWHLSWQQTDGIHYVEKLVRRADSAVENEPLGKSTIVREQVELEYTSFRILPSIEPEVFGLSHLGIPESTPFYDHRSNVQGKPKVVRWQQGELLETP